MNETFSQQSGDPSRLRTSPEPGVCPEATETEGELASNADATRRHLRGSGLLLAGRLLALGTNFLVQVLTVRYLTKSDYGAFAYALAAVGLGANVNLIGLQRAAARFVPMYHDRREYGAMLGTLILALGSIVGLGIAIVVLTFSLRGFLADSVVSNPDSIGLLLILIALCPLQALDSVCQSVVAALASPRAIFFRRHVLGPGLKLAAVLFVLSVQGSVYLLAACYLAAGAAGVLVYVILIHRILRQQGLWRFDRKTIRLPTREIFGFSLPLLTADVAVILKTTIAVLILESLRGSHEVAEFRAVASIAGLNLIVLQSLKLLFTPVATRLYSRGDVTGLNDIYWQSALWITVVTFPLFAVCVFLADPVTVLFYGSRYSNAGTVLAILAIGSYFNAAMGLNTYTLQVYARVRFVSLSNVAAMLMALALNFWLIPIYGAPGAAVATSGALVLQNILNHAGLHSLTDVTIFSGRPWRVYSTVLAALLVLTIARELAEPSLAVMSALVALVSLALVVTNRRSLRIADTFPELKRLPLFGRLIASDGPRG